MARMKAVLALTWRQRGRLHMLVTGGAWLVGLLFVMIIIPVAHADTYVTFATFAGLFCNILMTLTDTVVTYTQDYKEWIRHGTSRRTSLAGCVVMTVGLPLVTTAVLLLLYFGERMLWHGVFHVAQEMSMSVGAWIAVAAAVPAMWLLGALAAVIINRFGSNGMMVIYFVYLGISLCLSRVVHLIAPLFAVYTLPILIGGAVIAALGCVFLIRTLYRTPV